MSTDIMTWVQTNLGYFFFFLPFACLTFDSPTPLIASHLFCWAWFNLVLEKAQLSTLISSVSGRNDSLWSHGSRDLSPPWWERIHTITIKKLEKMEGLGIRHAPSPGPHISSLYWVIPSPRKLEVCCIGHQSLSLSQV